MRRLPPSAEMWPSREHLDLKPQLNTFEFLVFAPKTQIIALILIYLRMLKIMVITQCKRSL